MKVFSGKTVTAFYVSYESNIFSADVAKCPDAECKVSGEQIRDLSVGGIIYVVDTFAGGEAKRTFEAMEGETNTAISLLETRIKVLKKRLASAERRLRMPQRDLTKIKQYIRTGISKATGQKCSER